MKKQFSSLPGSTHADRVLLNSLCSSVIFPLLRRLSPSTAMFSRSARIPTGRCRGGALRPLLLVSTDPAAVQRDPLSQIIDIRIPASVKPTVADALRYNAAPVGLFPVRDRAGKRRTTARCRRCKLTGADAFAYCPAGAGWPRGSSG